mgnify:CR=1 FL=1
MKNDLQIGHIKTPAELGLALKRLRKNAGISQSELSKLMNMRQPTISDIENGRGTLDSFFKIVQALKLNIAIGNGNLSKTTKNKKIKDMINLLQD